MYNLDNYEVNSSTMAIIPISDTTSRVYEEEEQYIVNQSSNSIIRENCRFFGSSYKGRCEGTKSMTGIKSKFPVIIEESREIIFFPTASSRNYQNSWFALSKIKMCTKTDMLNTTVLFKNNLLLPVDVSVYSFENQIVRATMLKSKLCERKINK